MGIQSFYRSIVAIVAFAAIACCSLGARSEADVKTGVSYPNLSVTATPGLRRPNMVSRQEWNAKDPVGQMQPHTPQRITIHHTASPQKTRVTIAKKMQQLQDFSQSVSRLASGKNKPAWPDVPYHFYVAVDGQIAEGRDLKYAGDTNTDYDPNGHALVVLEGNFENEQPSIRQLESFRNLVAWLSADLHIPISEIKAHSDYASTACPGVNLKKALPTLRRQVAELGGRLANVR